MSSKELNTASSSTTKAVRISTVGLKVLELVMVLLCIGIIDDPVVHSYSRNLLSPRTIALVYVTYGAFCLYSVIFIIMKLFGDSTPWKTSALWSIVGFILFISTACLLLREWTNIKERNFWHPNTQRLDFICAVGAISIFAALLFLIDIILTILWGVRGEID